MANIFGTGKKQSAQKQAARPAQARSASSQSQTKTKAKAKTDSKSESKAKSKAAGKPKNQVDALRAQPSRDRQISDPEAYTLPHDYPRYPPRYQSPSPGPYAQYNTDPYAQYHVDPYAQYNVDQPLNSHTHAPIQRPRTANANLSPHARGPYQHSNQQPWSSTTNVAQLRPAPVWQPRSAPPMQAQFALSQQNLAVFEQQNPSAAPPAVRGPLDDIQDRMSVMITAMDEDEDEGLDDSLDPMGFPAPRALPGPNNRLGKLATQSRGLLSMGVYSKVWSYANSRLPPKLPKFQVYVPTYPLLTLAARYSLSAYSNKRTARPASTVSATSTVRIPQSLRLGTKAMVLALAPCMCSNTPTVVLAIRGSANFADWAVNFRRSPDSPLGFLDDAANPVHSGFLAVARSMLLPVAEQLHRFLAVQADRGKWRDVGQILLTGHSAGGAVASLLYCHLLSQSGAVRSPVKDMRQHFKRIHCVTFGAPPISLLPLGRPELALDGRGMDKRLVEEAQNRWRKNLFFAFINEGDPVVRADRAFIRSLLALYAASVPAVSASGTKPTWPVPESNMSNAGKIVVLRLKAKALARRRGFFGFGKVARVEDGDDEDNVEAVIVTDAELRKVVYGDPLMHSMRLYKQRIDTLAVKAMLLK